jgi:hypothetical protein
MSIDTLQRILQMAIQDGLLTPLRDRAARLRVLLYADDAAVFVNPVQADVDMLMAIMRHFGESTCKSTKVRAPSLQFGVPNSTWMKSYRTSMVRESLFRFHTSACQSSWGVSKWSIFSFFFIELQRS